MVLIPSARGLGANQIAMHQKTRSARPQSTALRLIRAQRIRRGGVDDARWECEEILWWCLMFQELLQLLLTLRARGGFTVTITEVTAMPPWWRSTGHERGPSVYLLWLRYCLFSDKHRRLTWFTTANLISVEILFDGIKFWVLKSEATDLGGNKDWGLAKVWGTSIPALDGVMFIDSGTKNDRPDDCF